MNTKLIELLKDWLPRKNGYEKCHICQEDMVTIINDLKNLDDEGGVIISLHRVGNRTHIEHVGKMKNFDTIRNIRNLIEESN